MKKIISGVLSAVMLTSVLCACNDGGNQSNASQSGDNASSSQQAVTTEAATTQPATEPNYEDTNYIAPIPRKNQTYKFEEISLDEAATSSGYSMSDSAFRINDADMYGEYLVVQVFYSNINSTDFCAYNVIFDLDGNMVANISNISLEEGYGKSGQIQGIYGDYTVLRLPIHGEDKYALYNLKTKELKYIDSKYGSPKIDNGVIVFGKREETGYKYGALDLDLNEIVPAEYDELSLASATLFRAKKDEKYGLIDFNNKVVVDFNYKDIVRFNGVEDDSFSAFVDFDKNINKYTLALDENDKIVLIDRQGKISDSNFEILEHNLGGRVVSQYDNKIYIKNNKIVTDIDGNSITDNVFKGNLNCGFVNGYCVTEDDDRVYNLVDSNGNVIYTKSSDEYEIEHFYSVDQNGLFEVVYSLGNSVKTEILDLSGNTVYSIQEKGFYPIGNGLFEKYENKQYRVYRVTAEWGEIYGKNKKKSCIKSDRRYFDCGRSDNIYCVSRSALWCADNHNPLGWGVYAGLPGKNKCDKFDTVLHIYGSCGGNGYCRHSYGVYKAEK